MDGLYIGIEKAHGDLPMMCFDDLTEMFGINQQDYMFMDGAVASPLGIRAKDKFGRTIRK